MPQEPRVKIVMQDNHREDPRRTPQEVVAGARRHVGIPKDTHRAKKPLRGEADPKGFGYLKVRDEDPGHELQSLALPTLSGPPRVVPQHEPQAPTPLP